MVRDGRYREASSLDDENFCYEPIAADADTPSMVLDRKGTEEIVGRMIDALPEVQRTTVILYYYDEMSVAAIAKTMGCSEGTVKSRLNYARKNLEQAVLAEEKCGVKLYSVTPALVFAAIRRMIAVMPISRASIIHTARRIAEEVQPSGFSSVSPDAESKAAKSSSAPEEIIRSTSPSKRRAYKTTGKKAPAGKASHQERRLLGQPRKQPQQPQRQQKPASLQKSLPRFSQVRFFSAVASSQQAPQPEKTSANFWRTFR